MSDIELFIKFLKFNNFYDKFYEELIKTPCKTIEELGSYATVGNYMYDLFREIHDNNDEWREMDNIWYSFYKNIKYTQETCSDK